MKEYNCPDCEKDDCEDCLRVVMKNNKFIKQLHIPQDFPDSNIWGVNQYIPNCCKNCPNHPTNGGFGSCQCVLPYYEQGIIKGVRDYITTTTTGGYYG